MNIAKDLGSLISGLFAPRASSPAQRIEQASTSRSRTTTREQNGNREKTGLLLGSDRLTLSSESISLANDSQEKATSTAASSTGSFAQPSGRLALPYSPSATSSAVQQDGEESPATRHLVRTTYGRNDTVNNSGAFDSPTRIDFHA